MDISGSRIEIGHASYINILFSDHIMTKTSTLTADRSKSFLLKLLPEQFDRLEEVFSNSTYKSKQKMGEDLLMKAVEKLAKKLGI